jgi:hypothetical protein
VTLSLVTGGVLVLAMIGISLYGARHLPPERHEPGRGMSAWLPGRRG